jgi:hypothetical protein
MVERGSKRRTGQVIFVASHFVRSGWLKVGNNENRARGVGKVANVIGIGFRTSKFTYIFRVTEHAYFV